MKDARTHLTPEELDRWLEGHLPADRASHLETCDECRTAAAETREVVLRLASLPKVSPSPGFSAHVLARLAAQRTIGPHLGEAELDDWLDGSLAADRQAHLRACPECRTLADEERLLVLALQKLPLCTPSRGFAEQVLAQVELPVTSLATAWRAWQRHTATYPSAVALASGIAVVLGGSLAASVAWASGYQDVITGLVQRLWSEGQQSVQLATEAAGRFLAQQPWYGQIRTSLTPGRLAGAGVLVTGLYVAGVLLLRKLLALPPGEVARAAH
jgi:anti-sigma factor RsiW